MIFQFGKLKFEAVTGFTSLNLSKEKNFNEQERLTGKPTLQSSGGVLDVIEGEIAFHHTLPGTGGVDQVQDVNAAIALINEIFDKEQDELFIDGRGDIWGRFVIKRLSMPIYRTDLDGAILSASMSISFIESIDDNPANSAASKARKSAFASISVSPIEVKKVPKFQSSPSSVMRDVISGTAAASSASENIKKAANIRELSTKYMAQGARNIARAKESLQRAREGVNSVENKITNAVAVRSAIGAVLTDLQNIQNNYTVTNLPGLKNIVTGMDNNINRVHSVTSSIVNVTLLRK